MSDKPRDFKKLVYNPITDELDMSLQFNPDRILTAAVDSDGNPLSEPQLVFDSDGNVVNR